ncbi:MAG: hypothetical protein A3D26_00560 [Candidatus Blackburnbacteria bacterium RIFCSPHIGHO2_02_FULL_44_20]|uniref:Uncharacterized protein n=1 Tax=Candidatus Blackburnbacteria bacterium RIFCSPHIGHO2_02_FULL_44_20 TaxID=1797516 RepID=A0A1G1V5A8_9BACT|nr:MAG: hypothetical protein A3D26_00560 [Candidatus Blackburnbacteria bacterium RIFCSPHIGHO2_02_FULL_44_20]OGY11655.1 MAG: hypothetical protein A3E16_01535 [Candidatus Blackburnbacteria bacterium RIFCSPHIGHO2_12_FULL_44_25]
MLAETFFRSNVRVEEFLPEDIFLIPGTGFDVNLEGRRIQREYNEFLSGKTHQELTDYLSRSTLESMTKFWEEYLQRKAVLGISVDRCLLNGETRMVLRRNGKPWITIFNGESPLVRNAAERIEEHVVHAKPGSITLLISPRRDELPESQIYIYHINEKGMLDATTIRVDRTTLEIEEFLEKLDPKYKKLDSGSHTEREKVEHLISWVPHLKGDLENHYDVPYVIEKLREAHPDLQHLFEQKTFEQVYVDFEMKSVYSLDEDCKNCLLKFQRFLESFFEQREELFQEGITDQGMLKSLKIAMGKTILDMSAIMRKKRQIKSPGNQNNRRGTDYYEELLYLQSLQGCVPVFGQESGGEKVLCPYCQKYVYVNHGEVCTGCGRTRPRRPC